ncbi:MAG TPA: hypothetical protein VFE52_11185, partial [Devosia sp.]|nr:hypothetical protein [Devosia sp.]
MRQERQVGWWPLVASWALIAAAFALRAWATAGTNPLILDTDDAMRLTIVHDLLAGQGWFEFTQYRLNTPYGAPMHWSRLVDLPIAALLVLLRPLVGAGAADLVVAYLWPTLLLFPFLWLTARLALRLGGRATVWPALLLPAFSLVTMAEFIPGRFDHHNIQIVLALVMLGSAIGALTRPVFAVGAGVAAGLAMTIGIESLPVVGATVMAFGLSWVARQ